ncbi:MAG TPA: TetR/AcrR family transcriptional regulator [Gammaproteobacteria bacterium]|nr:TetR/AcrR family transcriptional regulator [Gammaproteobacteria bacterium]
MPSLRPSRKHELLDALIAYLGKHGIADLSLRPMAKATGTSARLLIFHFGSKEELIQQVLEEMQARLQRSFTAMAQAGRKAPLLRAFWDWALTEPNYATLRLLYQLHMLAAQTPKIYGRYLKRNAMNWLELIQASVPEPQRDPAFVTLLGAVFDGLFMEFMSTGDRRRTTESLDTFIKMAQAYLGSSSASPSRR